MAPSRWLCNWIWSRGPTSAIWTATIRMSSTASLKVVMASSLAASWMVLPPLPLASVCRLSLSLSPRSDSRLPVDCLSSIGRGARSLALCPSAPLPLCPAVSLVCGSSTLSGSVWLCLSVAVRGCAAEDLRLCLWR
eukprot:1802124-Rhodomonas_salina.1